jgi:SAM-dependent methyltransferase
MDSLSLNFDQEFFRQLAILFSKTVKRTKDIPLPKEQELECRIGIPSKFDKRTGQWNFDSSVNKELFDNVKIKLDNIKTANLTISTVDIKITQTGEKIRKITTLNDNSVIYQKKNNIRDIPNVDSLFLSTRLDKIVNNDYRNVYMLRFALAEEETGINNTIEGSFQTISNQETYTRHRERYSYIYPDYVIDLTIIDYKTYSIELEYTREFLESVDSSKLDINNAANVKYLFVTKFFPSLKFLLRLLFPDLSVIYGLNSVTNKYADLLKITYGGNNVLNDIQPRNIKQEEVSQLSSNYSFTNKLNGTRFRILISKYFKDEIYLIFIINNTNIKFIYMDKQNSILSKYNDSIIDIEYFEYKGSKGFHAFDCPIFNKLSNTLKSHDERIKVLYNTNFSTEINNIINPYYVFEIKNFIYSKNAVADLDNIIRYMYDRYGVDIEEANDGIIMTPIGQYQDTKTQRMRIKAYYDGTFPIFKWKFPSTVSIDFLIKQIDVFKENSVTNKVFSLYVMDKDKLTEFKSFYRGKQFYPPMVYITNSSHNEYDLLQNGQIIELAFDRIHNQFRLLKIRTDKTEPNAKNTAEATFVDMETEFSLNLLKNLLQGKQTIQQQILPSTVILQTRQNINPSIIPLKAYRSYHNQIKRALIQKYAKNKRVLDLGAGKGGDLLKYKDAGITYLWAVEPNKSYIEDEDGFKDRLKGYPINFQKNVEIIETNAENTKLISDTIIKSFNDNKIDDPRATIISSFFSMSFFFKDQNSLSSLVKTISENLLVNGHFIGTMLDGQRTWNILNKTNGRFVDPQGYYYIQKKYPDAAMSIGDEIGVNLSGTPTVKNEQKEWLADFNRLTDTLAQQNITLVEMVYLDDYNDITTALNNKNIKNYYDQMSQTEKNLNSLYSYFVFKKNIPILQQQVQERKEQERKEISKNKLKMLQENRKEEGNFIKIYPETLFRVGTLGDGSCFAAGTEIHTLNGVKNIEDVEIGDEVITKEGNIKPVVQIHKNERGDRNIHYLKIMKSNPIFVTQDHRFWAIEKLEHNVYKEPRWVATEDLDENYMVMIPKRKIEGLQQYEVQVAELCSKQDKYYKYSYLFNTDNTQVRQQSISKYTVYNNFKNGEIHMTSFGIYCNSKWVIDEDFCEFLGIWYGDGCIHTTKGKHSTRLKGISIVSIKENTSLINFVKEQGEKIFGIKASINVAKKQNLVTISFANTLISNAFNNTFGKGFAGKRLPKFLYKMNDSCIKAFMTGLMSTDGCVDAKRNLLLTLANQTLITELYHLCRSIGLDVSVTYKDNEKYSDTGKLMLPCDSILISRLRKVYSDNRLELLKIKCENNNNNNYHQVEVGNNIGYAATNKTAMRYQDNIYLRVKENSITTEKDEYVYTLGIQDEHSYSVEGIIVENCFFYSFLYLIISSSYELMSKNQKNELASKLRNHLSVTLTLDEFSKLANGNLEYELYIPFLEIELEAALITSIKNNNEIPDITIEKLREIMATIITFPNINEQKNFLISSLNELGYDQEDIEILIQQARIRTMEKFQAQIKNCSTYADTYMIEYVMKKLRRNIFIIQDVTRLPLAITECNSYKTDKKSLIIIQINDNHFEPIIDILEDDEGTQYATLEFEFDHPLIQTLYKELCEKENK